MGASVSTTRNMVVRTTDNEVIQRSENICRATCTNQIDNVNVIVEERARIGDITIRQQCESNALCVMKTSLDSIALTDLNTDQNLDSSNPGKPFVVSRQRSVNNVTETLRNSVTQAISNVCDATAANIANNITFYVGAEAQAGDFNLTQEGVVSASCEIDSLASAENETISKVVQKQHQLARIIVTIAFFIFVLIGMAVYFYYRSADKAAEAKIKLSVIEQLGNLNETQTEALLKLAGNQAQAPSFTDTLTSAASDVASSVISDFTGIPVASTASAPAPVAASAPAPAPAPV